MKPKRKWTLCLMVSLWLIISMTACATAPRTNDPGWSVIAEGEQAPDDGYFVTYEAGRETAEALAERDRFRKEVVGQPSLFDRVLSHWAVFTVGVGIGGVGAIILVP